MYIRPLHAPSSEMASTAATAAKERQPKRNSVKIAHFGPPGLVADVLPSCFGAVGHEFMGTAVGSGLKPEPNHLMAADVVLLWVPPCPPSLTFLDDMHAILVLLEQQKSATPRRIMLLSNLLTWGSFGDAKASEDAYLKRTCLPSCEGLVELEAHVLRLDGPTLHTCVIASGMVYGAGEESLFKIMHDAHKLTSPLILPSSGNNIVPAVHVGVLCGFLCWLIDIGRFPKRYMFSFEPTVATLATIAGAVIDEWTERVTAGSMLALDVSSDIGTSTKSFSVTIASENGVREAGADPDNDAGGIFNNNGDNNNKNKNNLNANTDDDNCVDIDDDGGGGGDDDDDDDDNNNNNNNNGNNASDKNTFVHDNVNRFAVAAAGRRDIRSYEGLLEGCELSFEYPESMMLALDFPGLQISGSVFEGAMSTFKIRSFSSEDGTKIGLIGNMSGVIDEFVAARGLKPFRVWVLRQQGESPEITAIAKFVSQYLHVPLISSNCCIEWVIAQSRQFTDGVDGEMKGGDPQVAAADHSAPPNASSQPPSFDRCPMLARYFKSEICSLRDELRPFTSANTPLSSTLPPKLVARCVRIRLLEPQLVIHGYVLDACPANPTMLKDAFEKAAPVSVSAHADAEQLPICVAAALEPSHIVVISTNAECGVSQASTELKQWSAMEALDWRYETTHSTQGDTMPILESLRELFHHKVQLLSISQDDLITTVVPRSTSDANANPVLSVPIRRPEEQTEPWWRITDVDVESVAKSVLSSNALWESSLINLFDSDRGCPPPVAPLLMKPNYDVQSQTSAPVPAPIETTAASRLGATPRASRPSSSAHRCQFDDISQKDYDELHGRSTILREFLMDNVMTHLTKAMLNVIRLTDEDKIAKLADMLATKARHVEQRGNAYAYLRYRSSLAKLGELRQEEIEEDSSGLDGGQGGCMSGL